MPFSRRLPVTALLAAVAAVSLAVPAHAAPPGAGGTLIVKWPAGHRAAYPHALRHVRTLPLTGADVVRVTGRSLPAVAAELRRAGAVYAEPDRRIHLLSDDTYYPRQWGLENSGQAINGLTGVPGVDVRAPRAWATTQGAPSTVVAVIDTGVQVTHPDLAGQIWTNPGEVAGNGVDDDGDGYVDDVHGWNFVDGNSTLYADPDADAHATHVSGIIAAAAGNGIGVAGVAPGVRVMPLKVIGAGGTGTTSDAITAIGYAVAHGARVVNMSFGGPGNDPALRDAIAQAGTVAVVAAAGNDGTDNDVTPMYPAAYALPNLISVAALDNSGALASFSNYGRSSVAVAAPGSFIASTVPGGYGWMSGTSMATPFVSGVAALVASLQPGWSGAQVVARVKATARPLSALAGKVSTGGMVDAAAAVGTAACPAWMTSSSPFADVPVPDVHGTAVACVASWGVTTGVTATTFAPSRAVTRAQVASLVARLLARAGVAMPTPTMAFSDTVGDVHEADIDTLATLGVVRGVSATRYNPLAAMTRAQMATVLVRAYALASQTTPTGSRDYFGDDNGDVHEPDINAAREVGIAGGTSATTFRPGGKVTREQMASFLGNVLDLLVADGTLPAPTAPPA